MPWKIPPPQISAEPLECRRSAQYGPLLGHHKDDSTDLPRWGNVGKQRIEDAGPLYPNAWKRWTAKFATSPSVHRQIQEGRQTVLRVAHPTRVHIVTHLSPKYEAIRNSDNGWSEQEAGMAQVDDVIGPVIKKIKELGVEDNTIVLFTTDNGTEALYLARWWSDAVRAIQGDCPRRRLPRARDPALARPCSGRLRAERYLLRFGLAPHFRRGGRQSEHTDELLRAKRSLTEPTRTIWTATTRWPQLPAKARPRVTRFLPRRKHDRRGAHRRL